MITLLFNIIKTCASHSLYKNYILMNIISTILNASYFIWLKVFYLFCLTLQKEIQRIIQIFPRISRKYYNFKYFKWKVHSALFIFCCHDIISLYVSSCHDVTAFKKVRYDRFIEKRISRSNISSGSTGRIE